MIMHVCIIYFFKRNITVNISNNLYVCKIYIYKYCLLFNNKFISSIRVVVNK